MVKTNERMNFFTDGSKATSIYWSAPNDVWITLFPIRRIELKTKVVGLYEEFAAVLIRDAFSFSKDKELAQDAVQVCFFRVFSPPQSG